VTLSDLKDNPGARKRRIRVGRGTGSGRYMRPHTAIYVSSYYYMCHHTSYYHVGASKEVAGIRVSYRVPATMADLDSRVVRCLFKYVCRCTYMCVYLCM
jgi:hypothetical protein